MPKIVVQAGHQNVQYNSVPARRGFTGAPGEVEFNIDVANQVSAELRKRGFEVKQTDANANSDKSIIKPNDWDCFLAIHYDADCYSKPGGFVDFCDPEVDEATVKSQAIAKCLADEYFKTTGVENHPERSNLNTRGYYMWDYLSPATPCVLIECGIGWRVPDDHNLFTYHREKVIEGIVRGLCKAFAIKYDLTPEPTVDELVKQAVAQAIVENDAKWQSKMDTANAQIEALKLLQAESLDWSTLFSIAWKKWRIWKKTGGGLA